MRKEFISDTRAAIGVQRFQLCYLLREAAGVAREYTRWTRRVLPGTEVGM